MQRLFETRVRGENSGSRTVLWQGGPISFRHDFRTSETGRYRRSLWEIAAKAAAS
jgi:hypothetical protein